MSRTLFDDLRQTLESLSEQLERPEAGGDIEVSSHVGQLSVDVSETDDSLVVTADLPGFERDDIDVTVRDDTLHLRAIHETESEESDDEQYLRRERSRRSVSRTLRLPHPVDAEGANASFNNGVLTVTLPKSETTSGHRVEIQ